MALRDFQTRHVGTVGGAIWAIVQPLALVVVFYFVFAIGFRVQSPENTPFILWFVAGQVAWTFFNDSLMSITSSVSANAHLIKKTVFPAEIFAIIRIVSGTISHLIFLAILITMLLFMGIPFQFERLLVFYYYVSMVIFVLGLGWLLSALQPFFRDIGQALGIVLNVWFWATPIVWPENIIPEQYHWVLDYNPAYYLVTGYRQSMIYQSVVWPDLWNTAYFWAVTSILFLLGAVVFNRLKSEFVDVI
ncbi:ABC transporter permease [Rhizobium sp. Leaf262]|uniref:ABC transporter permease n=1 Tax=Rhizobium sp. Leaf262 TaxID=1736312 RepID=UPI00078478A4|nr:ABC transporter permease [Rhizobium sp. Leaf262]